jgi:hypothetical protein
LSKAKITDRINSKNPDNPVNPVENRHEKFFVSGTEIPQSRRKMPRFGRPAELPDIPNSLQMSQDFAAEHAEATEDKLEFLCALGVLCGEYMTCRFEAKLC